MAGKNTAAFGIYKTRSQAEQAVDRLHGSGIHATTTSQYCCPIPPARESLHTKKTPRRRRAQRLA